MKVTRRVVLKEAYLTQDLEVVGSIPGCSKLSLTLSQPTNFRLSKLKEFADDNFKFNEIDRKF